MLSQTGRNLLSMIDINCLIVSCTTPAWKCLRSYFSTHLFRFSFYLSPVYMWYMFRPMDCHLINRCFLFSPDYQACLKEYIVVTTYHKSFSTIAFLCVYSAHYTLWLSDKTSHSISSLSQLSLQDTYHFINLVSFFQFNDYYLCDIWNYPL